MGKLRRGEVKKLVKVMQPMWGMTEGLHMPNTGFFGFQGGNHLQRVFYFIILKRIYSGITEEARDLKLDRLGFNPSSVIY